MDDSAQKVLLGQLILFLQRRPSCFIKLLFSRCKLQGVEGWGGRDATRARSPWALEPWCAVSAGWERYPGQPYGSEQ